VSGTAEEVSGEIKRMALVGLLKKYSPDFLKEGKEYIESMNDITKVFIIRIEHISGKARRAN
jgi:nitroimidazol reductase NimA-like FMN-containing flavoprotein (pyridoxamine 5'-phosphate oxidase superfamily)